MNALRRWAPAGLLLATFAVGLARFGAQLLVNQDRIEDLVKGVHRRLDAMNVRPDEPRG